MPVVASSSMMEMIHITEIASLLMDVKLENFEMLTLQSHLHFLSCQLFISFTVNVFFFKVFIDDLIRVELD